MIKESDMSEDQLKLANTMSQISENCYCAGWIEGNEYGIWKALKSGIQKYGQYAIDTDLLEECGRLSAELHGWVIWVDDRDDPYMPTQDWGMYFIDLDQWVKLASSYQHG